MTSTQSVCGRCMDHSTQSRVVGAWLFPESDAPLLPEEEEQYEYDFERRTETITVSLSVLRCIGKTVTTTHFVRPKNAYAAGLTLKLTLGVRQQRRTAKMV